MRVGIVGCGLIGKRRAKVAAESSVSDLTVVSDVVSARASETAGNYGCDATCDWREVTDSGDVDIVVVATPNRSLSDVAVRALKQGKHVLCEKPPGRTALEAMAMLQASQESGKTLKIGFNHRHHEAVLKAHELYCQGSIGDLLWARGRYGHGGRPGYDQEWRGDPEVSGGGELLDQGIHLADLLRWFFGDFSQAMGYIGGYVWTGKGVEDNGFGLFRTSANKIASMHASWNQWKNLFSLEFFGGKGYLIIQGLGGSYGTEQLIWGKRRPESGPPDEEHFEFPGSDLSWHREWAEFVDAIREQREPLGSGTDGVKAMQMIEAVYKSSASGTAVNL